MIGKIIGKTSDRVALTRKAAAEFEKRNAKLQRQKGIISDQRYLRKKAKNDRLNQESLLLYPNIVRFLSPKTEVLKYQVQPFVPPKETIKRLDIII